MGSFSLLFSVVSGRAQPHYFALYAGALNSPCETPFLFVPGYLAQHHRQEDRIRIVDWRINRELNGIRPNMTIAVISTEG